MDKTATYTYAQEVCPCRELAVEPSKTNYEDEAIVFDVITMLAHPCRLGGRKFTVEMVPDDFTYGDQPYSEGNDGHPLLSVAAAKAQVERRGHIGHIAATIPEHESEGEVLTEASQTDDRAVGNA
jgi:hypothetical protein